MAGNVTLAKTASANRPAAAATTTSTRTFTGTVTVNATAGNDTVTGNGADTTLLGTNNASTYTIDDPATTNSSLVQGANTTQFNAVGNLTGGTAADLFKFASTVGAGVAGNIVGGGGSDTLDVSQQTGALVVNLQTGKFTQGGTDRIGGTLSGIGTVTGSDPTTTTNTTLVGPNGTQTFNVSSANSGTVAGVSFTQVGNLAGGSGDGHVRNRGRRHSFREHRRRRWRRTRST